MESIHLQIYNSLSYLPFGKMMLNSAMQVNNGFGLVAFSESTIRLIENLVEESKQEGFDFVMRTIEDWYNDANRFSHPGEGLWGLVSGAELAGIGGLNIDPYVEGPGTGRVRHLYIRPAHRRKGAGALLVNTIIAQARRHFRLLRLFTDNPSAAAFYERLGFEPFRGYRVSHVLDFGVHHPLA
jgi:GNAT superfamily N-acetyltransferase